MANIEWQQPTDKFQPTILIYDHWTFQIWPRSATGFNSNAPFWQISLQSSPNGCKEILVQNNEIGSTGSVHIPAELFTLLATIINEFKPYKR